MEPVPIACSLEGSAMPARLVEWQAVLSTVTTRSEIPGGMRLSFSDDVPIGDLARLTVAEQECCRFFSFAITVDDRGIALEITAPDDARSLVEAVFSAEKVKPPPGSGS